MITDKIYKTLNDEARAIRVQVFMEEQGFQDEFDEKDNVSVHAVIYSDDQPAATGRLYFEDQGRTGVIGRVAVLKAFRGLSLGTAVLVCLEKEAAACDCAKTALSAQCSAQGFYEKCGYQAVGEKYLDEHCEHIRMEKVIM